MGESAICIDDIFGVYLVSQQRKTKNEEATN